MIAALEKRTVLEFDADPLKTVLDYVAARVGDGTTISALADELSKELGESIYRPTLVNYLREAYGPEGMARLEQARLQGAWALSEEALEIVDDARPDKDEIALARLRAETRDKLAGRWNRAELGEQKQQTNVTVNLGTLHLDALRQRQQARATIAPTVDAEDVVVTIEGGSEGRTLPALAPVQ
jgi:hypothetical protein